MNNSKDGKIVNDNEFKENSFRHDSNNQHMDLKKNDPGQKECNSSMNIGREEETPDHSDFIDLSFRDDEENAPNSILFCALVFAKEFAKDEYERRNRFY